MIPLIGNLLKALWGTQILIQSGEKLQTDVPENNAFLLKTLNKPPNQPADRPTDQLQIRQPRP